jgi:hypothetical protein
MLERVNVVPPVLVSVTVFALLTVPTNWLENVRLVAAKLTAGAATPVPLRLMLCGLPDALSVIVIVPVRVPLAVGVNVMLMLQLPPAGSELPHVFASAKSPVAAMLVIFSVAEPVLVSVTDWAALVVPTCWPENVREKVDKPAAGTAALNAIVSTAKLLQTPPRSVHAVTLNATEVTFAPV